MSEEDLNFFSREVIFLSWSLIITAFVQLTFPKESEIGMWAIAWKYCGGGLLLALAAIVLYHGFLLPWWIRRKVENENSS